MKFFIIIVFACILHAYVDGHVHQVPMHSIDWMLHHNGAELDQHPTKTAYERMLTPSTGNENWTAHKDSTLADEDLFNFYSDLKSLIARGYAPQILKMLEMAKLYHHNGAGDPSFEPYPTKTANGRTAATPSIGSDNMNAHKDLTTAINQPTSMPLIHTTMTPSAPHPVTRSESFFEAYTPMPIHSPLLNLLSNNNNLLPTPKTLPSILTVPNTDDVANDAKKTGTPHGNASTTDSNKAENIHNVHETTSNLHTFDPQAKPSTPTQSPPATITKQTIENLLKTGTAHSANHGYHTKAAAITPYPTPNLIGYVTVIIF